MAIDAEAAHRQSVDPVAMVEFVEFAHRRKARSVFCYRGGELVAASSNDRNPEYPRNVYSCTKGVVSLLVGRAVTLGALDVDDTVGMYVPDADSAHAAITVRQLLTQTSGLRFSWRRDVRALSGDQISHTLALPFDHRPGTYFEYAQTTVSLLGYVVETAVGIDLQEFAQTELFTPIGIERESWTWRRDRAGHTVGWAHLAMTAQDLAKIGLLLAGMGVFNDTVVIDSEYLSEATTPSSANPGYGFLFWNNAGDNYVTATVPGRRLIDHRLMPGLPNDAYALAGFGDQLIVVIPSLDVVIVRVGRRGNRSIDPQAILTVIPGDSLHTQGTLLLEALSDVEMRRISPFSPERPSFAIDFRRMAR